MTGKYLAVLERQYMNALGLAILYQCAMTVEVFAAAHGLDPEELEALKTYLESHGVGV
jgi:hypothetical protein